MQGFVSDMERLLSVLRTIDDPMRLRVWLEEIRTYPSFCQRGLSYREVLALPGIRQGTLQLFPDAHGVIPRSGPLVVEWCIHQAMASQIYVRYVAYYGGMPNNR